MSDIKSKIVQVIPREISGQDTYRRYDFQIAIAFDLIISLIKKEENFALLMDYLDDIVLLDDEKNPSMINFYQVKTCKNKEITMTTILRGNWLNYMAENLNQFENSNSYFISNQYIKNNSKILFEDLDCHSLDEIEDSELKNTILSKISTTHSEQANPLKNYYIGKTVLSLDDYSDQVFGHLCTLFAEDQFNKFNSAAIKTLYQEIYMKLKTAEGNITKSKVINLPRLIEQKGLTSTEFNDIIANLKDEQLPENVKDIIGFAKEYLEYYFGGQTYFKLVSRYRVFINDYYTNLIMYRKCKEDIKDTYNDFENVEGLIEYLKFTYRTQSKFIDDNADFLAVIYFFKGGCL